MKTNRILILACAIALSACEKKADYPVIVPPEPVPHSDTKTFETTRLKMAITAYETSPNTENEADVKKAFAELDGEIAELEGHVSKKTGEARAEAAKKLTDLGTYRAQETVRFESARVKAAMTVPKPVNHEETAKDDLKDAGEEIKEAADKVGNSVEKGVRNVGDAIKDATR